MDTNHLPRYLAHKLTRNSQGAHATLNEPGERASGNPSSPVMLTVAEAAEKLRISRWMLYRLIQTRQLGTVKIGRRRFVPASSLQAFVEELSHVEEV